MVYAALNAVDMAQAHALAKLLMDQLRINKVVLLDSYVPSEYTSLEWNAQEEPPFIRWLHTSGAQQVPNVPHYEPPNLVRDLAAAIIGKCEIYGIECHALFSLQESLLGKHIVTADTCAAYATACGKLGMTVPLNDTKLKEILKHGGVDEHHHRLYL
ncbi:hypothetical protein BC940DRAFT_149497 [Gongronella butleri]|nr:hypothetical protein BC940DRAFT_149497 [Gongronella butleri]